ncbi:MAG: D-alanyl-D-alanine carboxypeptidase/D-alanyl-D-alanine-endopeptidase [Methylophilaceae bacterium]|nr:D-alanyl-D-alanine carboxypeptidase/D-alanyl-D-alanine-endopeptidase [Methylophilaceae bacterium]
MRFSVHFLLLCAALCWLAPTSARADAGQLPVTVVKALQAEAVPLGSVSVFLQRVDAAQAQINYQANVALNPASSMKLLTTYAGLELLGAAYRWRTELLTDGVLNNGVLEGNLFVKGNGDPSLMAEDFWRLLGNLRQLGVKDIRGDLVLDRSYFAQNDTDPGAFDGELYRAYNALPSATLVNLKSTSFRFEAGAQQVNIRPDPDLPEIKVINQLQLTQGDCPDWRSQLNYKVRNQTAETTEITFSGSFAVACGEKYLDLSLQDDATYTFNLFRKIWQQLGGNLHGQLRLASVPYNASKLMDQSSITLADVVRRINKYSNNLMARQLFLTIAAERAGVPATEANGDKAIHDWLASKNLNFPELVLENGSGLSRKERISAQHLGELLLAAYASPVMPELMSSLPVLAVDGTAERRLQESAVRGRAHLKTGSLSGVRSLAGYVLDAKGRRWVVVFMVNHAQAAATKAAQDALLDWVYQQD